MSFRILEYMRKYQYENLVLCHDQSVGLNAVIAIHDTTLGPAAGGCRMWRYTSEWDAIEDALRLSRGMTYKYAAAGVNLGGGKAVILGDPRGEKSEALFRAMGRFIHRLNGTYLTGEDVGTTLRDMEYMRMETPYVITLPESWGGAGPISGATAFGVVQGMKACLETVFGSTSLKGRRVSVQGVGAVGSEVVPLLVNEGSVVTVSDIDTERAQAMVNRYGVKACTPNEAHALDVDVYCPCALGAVVNDDSIGQIRARIVCGSANNQLREERHGDALHERGILYAPDYIVNAGGTIFDTDRINPGGFNRERALGNVTRIYETTKQVIANSRADGIPTYVAADRLAERRIADVGRAKSLVTRGGLLRE